MWHRGRRYCAKKNDNSSSNCKLPPVSPSSALVIAGLLAGVFIVDSILVDRAQNVEVILSGSLKKETQMEKIMDQIGKMPFDEVLKVVMGRLG